MCQVLEGFNTCRDTLQANVPPITNAAHNTAQMSNIMRCLLRDIDVLLSQEPHKGLSSTSGRIGACSNPTTTSRVKEKKVKCYLLGEAS
jgi:hypothetical protein